MLTAVLHYCGDSELTNGKTIVKNSKLTNGIAFFPQQMQSHKTLATILKRVGEFNNLMQQMINFIFVELWKNYAGD